MINVYSFCVSGRSLFPFDDAKVIRFFASRQTFRELPAIVYRTHSLISDKQQKWPRFLSENGAFIWKKGMFFFVYRFVFSRFNIRRPTKAPCLPFWSTGT